MAQRFKERLLAGSGYSNKKVESAFGEKMLKKMGWTEGKGLGKSEDGIAECVQQRRREQGQGLGVEDKKGFKWNDNWWDDVYNNAIKQFKFVKKDEKVKKQKQSSTGSSSSNSCCSHSSSSDESSSQSDDSIAKVKKTKKIEKKKVVIIKKTKKTE